MKTLAVDYHKNGYNCSQCILRALEDKFDIEISEECYNLTRGINEGFGIGATCSLIIAGTMAFGLFFDDNTVKSLRLKLIDYVNENYGVLDCGKLKRCDKIGEGCLILVGDVANYIEKLILEELGI